MPALISARLPALALLSALVAPAALAANPCQPGASVTDRQGRTGTVAEADKAGCQVNFPDGSQRYYLGWMLRAAGSNPVAAQGGSKDLPGSYHCVAAGGIAGTLKLVIIDGSTYGNGTGKSGSYTQGNGGKLQFSSGPWEGYYGKVLGPGRIGLSSRDNDYYGTTCDRK